MIPGHMSQHQSDHLVLALSTGEVTTFASDLLEHDHSLPDTLQFLAPKRRGGQWVRTQANPPGCSCAGHSPLSSRAGGWIKPSRAGRVGCSSRTWVLSRLQPVPRDTLIDALWGDAALSKAGAALSALICW
jgi:hypothetical protein